MGTVLTVKKTDSVSNGVSSEEPRTNQAGELGYKRAANRRARILPYFDITLIGLSAIAGFWAGSIYAHFLNTPIMTPLTQARLLGFILVHSVCLVLLVHSHGLYSASWKRTFREELSGLAESVASAAVVLFAALFFADALPAAFVVAGLTIGIGWFAMAGWRRFLYAQSIPGLTERRTIVIVGAGQLAMRLEKHITENPELGFVVRGFIDRRKKARDASGNVQEDSRFLGSIEDLPAIVRAHFVDEIFVCVPGDRHFIREVAAQAKDLGVHLRVVPEIGNESAIDIPIEYVGDLPTLTLQEPSIPTVQLIFKRLFDICASAMLIVGLAPLLLLVSVLIKAESEGPVLYRSLRVGRKGNTFVCLKFRTMVANAEKLKASLMHLNERDEILFKISNDPRITRLGRILRKYSLDELPQLFNVLKGDMSLVGPRPPVPDEYQRYALEHLQRLDVTPGVTGLWQVTARRCTSFDNYIQLDREYIENWSFWLDCKILVRTIAVTLAGTGQ